MMKLEQADKELISPYDYTCEEHGTPADFVLRIGSVVIPLCEYCVKELKDTLEDVKLHQMATQSEMSVETINALAKERDELAEKFETLKEGKCYGRCDLLVKTQKERDELKAKLAGECKNCVSQEEAKVLAESLAAAERCIEDVFSAIDSDCSDEVNKALDIIRAYREQKEVAK